MTEHDHSSNDAASSGSFWRSRGAVVLLVFLAVVGLLLGYEHRAHVFTQTGFLIGLLALCVGMHFFMHGGHGGDDGRGEKGDRT